VVVVEVLEEFFLWAAAPIGNLLNRNQIQLETEKQQQNKKKTEKLATEGKKEETSRRKNRLGGGGGRISEGWIFFFLIRHSPLGT